MTYQRPASGGLLLDVTNREDASRNPRSFERIAAEGG